MAKLDGLCEVLRETETGRKPSSRTSLLRHTWVFAAVSAEAEAEFVWAAARGSGGDHEDFALYWSVNGGQSWTKFADITSTTLPSAAERVALPAAARGAELWIQARDADGTPGTRLVDELRVDQLVVLIHEAPPSLAPSEVRADGKSESSILVGWVDNASTETGFRRIGDPSGILAQGCGSHQGGAVVRQQHVPHHVRWEGSTPAGGNHIGRAVAGRQRSHPSPPLSETEPMVSYGSGERRSTSSQQPLRACPHG